jgi:hypothetical protein
VLLIANIIGLIYVGGVGRMYVGSIGLIDVGGVGRMYVGGVGLIDLGGVWVSYTPTTIFIVFPYTLYKFYRNNMTSLANSYKSNT